MKINIHINYFQENDFIVALSPELSVSSFGDTIEEAEKSIREALDLFFDACEDMGTLIEVLEESGYYKIKDEWLLSEPLKTTKTSFQWSGRSEIYA